MNLEKKINETEKAINGKGIIIDPNGFIYRLAVNCFGEARLCMNRFLIEENTIVGNAIDEATHDYKNPEDAIREFERIKAQPGMVWRQDDRVFYSKG